MFLGSSAKQSLFLFLEGPKGLAAPLGQNFLYPVKVAVQLSKNVLYEEDKTVKCFLCTEVSAWYESKHSVKKIQSSLVRDLLSVLLCLPWQVLDQVLYKGNLTVSWWIPFVSKLQMLHASPADEFALIVGMVAREMAVWISKLEEWSGCSMCQNIRTHLMVGLLHKGKKLLFSVV